MSLWFVTFVTTRFGELFRACSDQSELAEFGDKLDHCSGEASGDGVGYPFKGWPVVCCTSDGDVVSVVLWCDGGVGYWNIMLVLDVADDGVGNGYVLASGTAETGKTYVEVDSSKLSDITGLGRC